MCLGIPGKVVEANEASAIVDFWGVKKRVRLEIVDEPVNPGDYVLVHVGFAIRRIPEDQVAETLEFYDVLIRAAEEEEDLMARDIRREVEAVKGMSDD